MVTTRKLSINLTALGVITSRSSKHSSSTIDQPPAKRIKRSHTIDSCSSSAALSIPVLPSRPRARKISSTPDERHAVPLVPISTPPPSPLLDGSATSNKIDKQGISDEIVVAVLTQLEATGNKPHLIKELVAVLTNILPVVETSQNPVAIISSRLTNYLKRPWTVLAPCPLAKEQVTVHPRRVYYYLTTTPHQQIPEYAPGYKPQPLVRHVISPSISSGPDDEDMEPYIPGREHASPSPELDLMSGQQDDLLSAHDIAETHFDSADFSLILDESEHDPEHDRASPSHNIQLEPLEHDEREFSRMAGVMRQRHETDQAEVRSRSPSGKDMAQAADPVIEEPRSASNPVIRSEAETMSASESDELGHLGDQEAAAALFGHATMHHHLNDFTSSPMLRPVGQSDVQPAYTTPRKAYFSPMIVEADRRAAVASGSWGELKSPEDMDIAELDDLLGC